MYTPQGNPRETFSENHSSNMSCFPNPHFLAPKRSPAQNVGPRGPDLALRPQNQKDAHQNMMMQNPAGINSNGATRCKLWPKNILGVALEFGGPLGSFGAPFGYLWSTSAEIWKQSGRNQEAIWRQSGGNLEAIWKQSGGNLVPRVQAHTRAPWAQRARGAKKGPEDPGAPKKMFYIF